MITKKQLVNLLIKILPVIIVISATFLLIHEIDQFNKLPSKYADNSYTGYLKYKEDTYCQLFLWTLLLIVGIISLINSKLKWVVYQIFIIKLWVSSLLINFVDYIFEEIRILSGIIFIGLILIEIQLYKQNLTSKLKINKANIVSSIILGLISAAIYWTIRLNS